MGFEIRTLKRTISTLALGALLLVGTAATASAHGNHGRGRRPNQRAWWGQTRRANNLRWRDRRHELQRHQREERVDFRRHRRDVRDDDVTNVGDRRDRNRDLRDEHRDLRQHQRQERQTFKNHRKNN